jgi:UDP-glucose 4-epimerase
LAQAHVAAVLSLDDAVPRDDVPGCQVINLGTGRGTTVFELVAAFESVTGARIRLRRTHARPGDVAGAYPDTARAKNVLGWECGYGLEDGIEHALEWRAVDSEQESVLSPPIRVGVRQ